MKKKTNIIVIAIVAFLVPLITNMLYEYLDFFKVTKILLQFLLILVLAMHITTIMERRRKEKEEKVAKEKGNEP